MQMHIYTQKSSYCDFMSARKICFIGFGNTIRSDDGLGPYIIAQLEQRLCRYDNFTFITLHQIDLALAPSLIEYNEIIFIDAAVDIDDEVIIEKIIPAQTFAFTTHTGSIQQLLHIASKLYSAVPICRIMRVRGHEFGFGEELSEKGKQAAERAVDAILAYIMHDSL